MEGVDVAGPDDAELAASVDGGDLVDGQTTGDRRPVPHGRPRQLVDEGLIILDEVEVIRYVGRGGDRDAAARDAVDRATRTTTAPDGGSAEALW